MARLLQISDDIVITAGDELDFVAGDSSDVLLRVRQKAMRVDAVNKNNRLYPRKVVCAAIDACLKNARNGVMLSEDRHPPTTTVKNKDFFVDRPDEKTATVDDIEYPDSDGWVYVTRSIRDTPKGRIVAGKIRRGEPAPLSTRFTMSRQFATIDGHQVAVANTMTIHTWDDVTNPAVKDAGTYQLLTDEERSYVDSLSGGSVMNPDFIKALNAYNLSIAGRKGQKAVFNARKACVDAMEDVMKEDKDGNEDMSEMGKKVAECDAIAKLSGYHADGPDPVAVTPTEQEDGKERSDKDVPAGKPYSEKQVDQKPTDKDLMLKGDALEYLNAKLAEDKAAKEKAAVDSAIEVASKDNKALAGFGKDHIEYITRNVRNRAGNDATKIAELLGDEIENFSKITAAETLAKRGLGVRQLGQGGVELGGDARVLLTTNDRPPRWMAGVDKILLATDENVQRQTGTNAGRTHPKRRARNRKILDRMVAEYANRNKFANPDEMFAASDTIYMRGEEAFCDDFSKEYAARDATTTSNILSQPTIFTAVLYQAYQDLIALEFVEAIGPSLDDGVKGGWFSAGSGVGDGRVGVGLRLPVAYYNQPTGYGNSGADWDEGLLTPEGAGIDTGGYSLAWQTFGPLKRSIATSITKEAAKQIGNSPLNWNLVAQNLYGISYDKQRRTDRAILNELLNVADNYLSVAVTNEGVSLANNTSYLAGGSVVVNLNPAKTATTAPTSTDPSAAYGTNVVAAVRVVGGKSAYYSAGTYCGTINGPAMIVRPQTTLTVDGSGNVTKTVNTAITVSAPAAMVEGYLDTNLQIQDKQGATGSTFAVDHNNGVIVFKTGAVAGAAGVITTTPVTISYTYATNYNEMVLKNAQALSLLATGETPQMYYNRLFDVLDTVAGDMGVKRFAHPDTLLMREDASHYISSATIFYENAQPKGTDFLVSEDQFMSRNNQKGFRHNAPWGGFGDTILSFVSGTSKFAIDTAWEMEGPFPSFDSTGRVIDQKIYYGTEISTLCTPLAKDTSSNILNHPSVKIKIR